MKQVGVRALKQNASAVVAEAASGAVITITDRGRPVALIGPIPADPLAQLIDAGRARPARRRFSDLGPALAAKRGQPPLSRSLEASRATERY